MAPVCDEILGWYIFVSNFILGGWNGSERKFCQYSLLICKNNNQTYSCPNKQYLVLQLASFF